MAGVTVSSETAELLELFHQAYPNCKKLGIAPARHGKGFFASFDTEELLKDIGQGQFNALMATVKAVYSHGHVDADGNPVVYPADHANAGHEVHCVAASEVEAFLAGEVAAQEAPIA